MLRGWGPAATRGRVFIYNSYSLNIHSDIEILNGAEEVLFLLFFMRPDRTNSVKKYGNASRLKKKCHSPHSLLLDEDVMQVFFYIMFSHVLRFRISLQLKTEIRQ